MNHAIAITVLSVWLTIIFLRLVLNRPPKQPPRRPRHIMRPEDY